MGGQHQGFFRSDARGMDRNHECIREHFPDSRQLLSGLQSLTATFRYPEANATRVPPGWSISAVLPERDNTSVSRLYRCDDLRKGRCSARSRGIPPPIPWTRSGRVAITGPRPVAGDDRCIEHSCKESVADQSEAAETDILPDIRTLRPGVHTPNARIR